MQWRILAIWLNYNSMHIIRTAILSLKAFNNAAMGTGADVTFVFVDNCSHDGSYEILKSYVEKLYRDRLVVRTSRNWGFTGGVNIGYMVASSIYDLSEFDYLVLINNDIVADRGSLASILKYVHDLGLGAGQGVILSFKGGIDNWGFMVDEFLFEHPVRVFNPKPGKCILVSYVSGAFPVYSMDAIRKCIGLRRLFHEALPAFFDDNIIGLRLWNCGFPSAAIPVVAGVHLHSATFSKYPEYMFYNAIGSYAAKIPVVETRFKRLLPLILLKVIARHGAKLRVKPLSVVRISIKAVRDGLHYGQKLRTRGLTINLYRAPYIQVNSKHVIKQLTSLRLGLNSTALAQAIHKLAYPLHKGINAY